MPKRQNINDRITEMLESLAWHHGNVQQHAQPGLEFGEGK